MSVELAPVGRGPDPMLLAVELELGNAGELVQEALALDVVLVEFLERWHANERRLAALRLRGPGTVFMSRYLRNALRMHAGEPFWDREPPEPA